MPACRVRGCRCRRVGDNGNVRRASRLSVVVDVGIELRIKVAADGQRMPDEANNSDLAEQRRLVNELGGTLTVEPAAGSETVLQWSVPLPEQPV